MWLRKRSPVKKNRRVKKDRLLFWIVTGMSGAGKSHAINCFEDFGFFCVDNLPVALLPKMAELCTRSGDQLHRVALGIDVREGSFLHDLYDTLARLKKDGVDCRIVFLDADDKTLYRRFSETRRRHPLGKSVREGVREERKRLLKLKEMAHRIIDTSNLTLSELKENVSGMLELRRTDEMQLGVISFGYKYGLPADVDIIWDVRFLPNPNYVPRFKNKTGQMPAVRRYVLSNPLAQHFEKKFFSLLLESLPHYMREGKSYLTVAIGCTGGRHRSVAIAEALKDYLSTHKFKARVHHRDIDMANPHSGERP
jgi:RNase adapter protein RapZ